MSRGELCSCPTPLSAGFLPQTSGVNQGFLDLTMELVGVSFSWSVATAECNVLLGDPAGAWPLEHNECM